ncbi:MAG: hypothetical protein IPI49_18170 [Myxococcales bacterium]|nr:hypothetical protein [Myxococcales bacterium]HRC55104.1 hypothetical protein [Kofleriaceae bacterium]
MTAHELWKRRLGPLWGAAVALTSSSVFALPALDGRDDSPGASWLVGVGVALGLAGYAVAAAATAAGVPSSVGATLGLLAMIFASGACVERATAALLTGAADSATATTAVAGSLLMRAQLLAALPPSQWLWAFPAACVTGRWAAAFLQGIGDPILDPPARSLVCAAPPAWELAALTAALAVTGALALGPRMLLALGAAAAVAFGLGLWAQRRRGGLDAEVVGAAALGGEGLALLVLAAA